LMPAPANQSLQSLQLLQSGPDGASVSSLPISESEDDTQGVYCVCMLNGLRGCRVVSALVITCTSVRAVLIMRSETCSFCLCFMDLSYS